jgi:hypothetical protein
MDGESCSPRAAVLAWLALVVLANTQSPVLSQCTSDALSNLKPVSLTAPLLLPLAADERVLLPFRLSLKIRALCNIFCTRCTLPVLSHCFQYCGSVLAT